MGQGQPISKDSGSREKLNKEQISHFIDFIMTPAIMTDAPFGNMQLKLSSGHKIDVPKIILNSVRSRVVDQYQQYCKENNFVQSASERSYMRILQAVEPSIRKSMKGLDNFAADGASAFEDLQKIAESLGFLGKGKEWAKEIRTALSAGKQYLKLEYKVTIFEIKPKL